MTSHAWSGFNLSNNIVHRNIVHHSGILECKLGRNNEHRTQYWPLIRLTLYHCAHHACIVFFRVRLSTVGKDFAHDDACSVATESRQHR
jgi:hypothetical protein